MKTLDDLLNAAADDIRSAAEQLPIPSTFPDDDMQLGRHSQNRSRLLVGVAAITLLVAGIVWIQGRATDPPATVPAGTTTSTIALFDAASPPLELTVVPPGYANVGQIVRPIGDGDIRSAVFVKRDEQGAIIGKVRVRLGDLGLLMFEDGQLLPPSPDYYQQPVTAPANLPMTAAGQIFIEGHLRVIHVQFPAGDLGNLELESYHLDTSTDLETADQMLAIAAALDLTTTPSIGVVGPLPEGWELAVTGLEPGFATREFFQAFEVDVPEGGNKIIISNWMTNDVGVPYWEMDDTLAPIVVRGHAGFVSTIDYPPTDPNAPPPPNADGSTSLIWLEAPGHWVTFRGHDMTTEQVLALADQLTPSANGQWGQVSGSTVTTTTVDPRSSIEPIDESDVEFSDLTQLVVMTSEQSFLVRQALDIEASKCMSRFGFEYEPETQFVDITPVPFVPTAEEVALHGYMWRSRRFEQQLETEQQLKTEQTSTLGAEAQAALGDCMLLANGVLQMDSLNGPGEIIGSARNQLTADALSDPSYIAVLDEWVACLEQFGYVVERIGSNASMAELLPGGASGAQGIQMAVRDYACQEQVGLNTTLANLVSDATREWLAANLSVVEEYRLLQAQLIARARAIVG